MLVIDGSYLEGGGQIVRTAIGLASLFKIPVKIINIRANRKPPGLKQQHYTMVKFLAEVTEAEVKGLALGSRELYFKPKTIHWGKYFVDIKTAGSITLFLQGAILPLLFADSKVELTIKGGTDVTHSPSMDYFRFVFLPYIKRFAEVDLEIIRRGFYPRGGGIVRITINPRLPRDLVSLEQFLENLKKIEGYNLCKTLTYKVADIYSVATVDLKQRKVAERMLNSAIEEIEGIIKIGETKVEYVRSLSTGAVITIVGHSNISVFGSDFLGEKKKKSEEVGSLAGIRFRRVIETKSSVDENLADMLIPYMGLVREGCFITPNITNHLLTNIWVSEKFLGKIFRVSKNKVEVQPV